MPFARVIFLLSCLLVSMFAQAASVRVLVLSDGSAISRQVQQRVETELHRATVTQTLLAEINTASKAEALSLPAADVVLAIGPSALRHALSQPGAKQIVAMLVSRSMLDAEFARAVALSGRAVHAIVLDQPVTRYFNLIRLALPKAQRVGLLYKGTTPPLPLRTLEKQAEARGMTFSAVSWTDDSTSGLIARLEELLGQSDVLLALPDAAIHSRMTVQPLLLTTYRAAVPVVAYSEAYGRAGALLALYSTPEQLAQQAGEVIVQILQSRNPAIPSVLTPKYFSVYVNSAVARSLGLSISSGIILQEGLRLSERSND